MLNNGCKNVCTLRSAAPEKSELVILTLLINTVVAFSNFEYKKHVTLKMLFPKFQKPTEKLHKFENIYFLC